MKKPLPPSRRPPVDPMPPLLVALRAVAPILEARGLSHRQWAVLARVGHSTLAAWLEPKTVTADLASLCRALKAAGVRPLLSALYGKGADANAALDIARALQDAGVWGPAPEDRKGR